MNPEEILRKLPRTISHESAIVSGNQTLINLLPQNRVKKVWGKRGGGREIPSCMVANEEILHEEQQPGPCNNLVESSNDESSDEEYLDNTTYEFTGSPG